MFKSAAVRRRIYALSAAVTPCLIIWGVEANSAAAYAGAAVAVANLIMAILNVPGDEDA